MAGEEACKNPNLNTLHILSVQDKVLFLGTLHLKQLECQLSYLLPNVAKKVLGQHRQTRYMKIDYIFALTTPLPSSSHYSSQKAKALTELPGKAASALPSTPIHKRSLSPAMHLHVTAHQVVSTTQNRCYARGFPSCFLLQCFSKCKLPTGSNYSFICSQQLQEWPLPPDRLQQTLACMQPSCLFAIWTVSGECTRERNAAATKGKESNNSCKASKASTFLLFMSCAGTDEAALDEPWDEKLVPPPCKATFGSNIYLFWFFWFVAVGITVLSEVDTF